MGYLRATTFQKENQQEKTSNDQFYSFSNNHYFFNVKFNYDPNYFIEHCFILPIDSCPIDPTQIEIFYRQINNDRRVNNFETFVGSTNEKQQTSDITSALLENYIFKVNEFLQSISVVDLGVGQGTLSSKVATSLKGQCNELSYEGIDREAKFIDKNRKIFLTLEIKESKFVVGDCFGGDVDQLVDHPTILIASQVVFYAPDVGNFIDLIVRKMGAVAFVIGQTNPSFLNKMNKEYAGAHKQKDVESKVENSLTSHSEKILSSNILYSSYIDFPKIKDFKEIAYDCYDCITDPNKKKARELMESMCGASLEYIEYKSKLDNYMADLQAHLTKMDGQGIFWNFMQVIIPNEGDNNQKLKDAVKVIYSQKFSGNLIEPNKAIIEGNVEALRDILKSGMIIPEIADPKSITLFEKLLIVTRMDIFIPLLCRDYKASENRKEFIEKAIANLNIGVSELLWDNVDENTNIQNIENIYYEIKRLISHVSQEGIKSNIAWFVLIGNLMGYTKFVIDTANVVNLYHHIDVLKIRYWLYANSISQIYAIYMHSNTDFVLAHSLAAEGKTEIFRKFFPYMNESVNKQSGTGKTALHYALEFSHTEIARMLLSSNQTEINIRDNRGYLPVHYAAANGNKELVDYFVNKRNVDISEVTDSYLLSWAYITQLSSTLTSLLCFCIAPIGSYKNDKNGLYNTLDTAGNVLTGQILTTKALVAKITTPEVSFLPVYAREGFLDETFPFNMLIKDSLLHLATRNNQTETSLWLMENNIKQTLNAEGMVPIHLAAANNNLKIIKAIILEDYNQINKVAYLKSHSILNALYFLVIGSIFSLPILAVNPVVNQIWIRPYNVAFPSIAGWCLSYLLFKVSNLYGNKYGNILHFSASGLTDIDDIAQNYLTDITDIAQSYFNESFNKDRYLTKELDEQKLATLEFLVGQGVDVEYGLTFGLPVLEPLMIGMSLTNTFLFFHRFWVPYASILSGIIITTILYYENIRPIDVVEKYVYDNITNSSSISESYKFLKQYTSVDLIKEMSYLEYLSYYFGLRSKNDVITIKKYGAYSGGGGDGEDKFIITKNFEGKENGLKIIIKDYKTSDEIILDSSFGIFNVSDIKYKSHQLLSKNATTLYTGDNQEIVTLLNYNGTEVKVTNFYSEEYVYTESWWQYLFQNKKIELNAIGKVYQSDTVDAIFSVTNPTVDLSYKIMNFDCDNKNQKLDFRGFENIKNIFDLELILSCNLNISIV